MSAGDTRQPIPSDFDVRAWLGRIGLAQYADAFAENEISGVALAMLTEEDLKACGVRVLGHRKIILHEIQKLEFPSSSPASPADPAGTAETETAPAPPSAPVAAYETRYVFTEDGVEIGSGVVEPGEYVIGRDPKTCFFLLENKLVSRRHAQLTITASQWLIEDMGSSGGTLLNGFPIKEPTHILPTQRIQLGPVTLALRRDLVIHEAAPPPPSPSTPPPPGATAMLSPVPHKKAPGPPNRGAIRKPEEQMSVPADDLAPTMRAARPTPPAGKSAPAVAAPLAAQPRVQRSRSVWKRKDLGFWGRLAASKFLVVSIAAHCFFGVGAAVYVVQRYQASRKLTFQGGPPLVSPSKRVLEHKVSMAKKKNTMSAPAQAKRITTTGLSKVTLPDMPALPNAIEVMPKRMSGMGGLGTGPGFGTGGGGMGTGMSVGGGTFALPKVVGDRCSAASRAAAMKSSGGDPKCEEAIMKGLNFLKAHQNADGSWGSAYKNAMSGLALLSYLGHCERPGDGDLGPTVRKGIDYLVKFGTENNGKLGKGDGNGWAYEHGIASYALGEAYIFTREEAIGTLLRQSLKMIIDGQGADGGWVYGFTKAGNGDTSVSGWQVQALKAAHLTDLNIEGLDPCMKKAMDNMLRVQGTKGGFGYRDKGEKWGLTGVGVFCLQIGTNQKGGPVRNGLEYLQDKGPEIKYKGADANLYAWYYNTQACFHAGGYFWGKWNRAFQPELLANQQADGCWAETGSTAKEDGDAAFHYSGRGNSVDAKVYRTSLSILMLEVFYRYLATNRN